MSLKESRAAWRAKELYRYNKWRFYRYKSKRPDDERMALRTKWFKLYTEARDQRVSLDRQLAAPTKMSNQGLQMLIRSEGSVPYAYNDPAGYATFGVGHLLHKSRVTAADEAAWGSKARPKPERVLPVLREDIAKFENGVRKALKRAASQKQFDAMVHLAFNIGLTGFLNSSVLREHNAGNKMAAADAFLMWSKPAMLRGRRIKERALYLGGPYS